MAENPYSPRAVSKHFGIGEMVKRAHLPPERVIGIFVSEFGGTRLTLLADDDSVTHVFPIALNHHND